jgi:hypothetical protein
MTPAKKAITKLLAQAIIDVNDADHDVRAVIDQLNIDLLHQITEPVKSERRYLSPEDEWDAPIPMAVEKYIDCNGRSHSIPRGYRLRIAYVTNYSWCETYNTSTQEPNYVFAKGGSGAPYVDLFFERVALRNYDVVGAIAFFAMLKEDYMLKTANHFGADTAVPCEYLRFTTTHSEFIASQEQTA